jgi:gluconate kinase
VLAQLFLSDKNRHQVRQSIPGAIWVHVEVEPDVRFARLKERHGHFAGVDYAKKMDERFEPITIEYQSINNDYGTQHIKDQLDVILGQKG